MDKMTGKQHAHKSCLTHCIGGTASRCGKITRTFNDVRGIKFILWRFLIPFEINF